MQIGKDTIRQRLPGVSFPSLRSGSYWIANAHGKTCVMGTAFLDGECIPWSVVLNGKEPEQLKLGSNNEPEPVQNPLTGWEMSR